MARPASRPIRAAADDPVAAVELTSDELRSLARRFGSPLLVVDCDKVRHQYRRLSRALPGVALHYALKPLPHASVVATLRDEGACFDLATSGEIDLVRQQKVAPERCIHTHPIKRDSDIRDALRFGVTTFVADNPDEILKFVRHRKRAELLLRVSFRSPDAVCDLSRKFGCDPDAALELLRFARRHGVRVRGLSFHVGSQARDPAKYVEAIDACTDLIAAALLAGLPALDTLDIGGGFPVAYGDEAVDIDAFCAPIRTAIARLPRHVRVIAEPGRFIAAPAALAVATVMGKAQRGGEIWYYLDDGLYGSYSGQLYDHARYPIEVVRVAEAKSGPSPLPARSKGEGARFATAGAAPLPVRERSTESGEGAAPLPVRERSTESGEGAVPLPVRERSTESGEGLFPSVLAGPTCDSIDVIAENLALPELEIGDLIVGRNMGAYTWASATDFNFFPRARVVVLNESALCDGRIVPLRRRRA